MMDRVASAGLRTKDWWIDTLKDWDVEKNPRRWLVLNLTCLVLSILELGLIAHGPESKSDRLARKCYLVYNLFTSVVWCLEVGVPVAVHGYAHLARWYHKFDLALAGYFLLDSIRRLVMWKMKKDHTKGMAIDCFVNVAAYTYASVMVVLLLRRRANDVDRDMLMDGLSVDDVDRDMLMDGPSRLDVDADESAAAPGGLSPSAVSSSSSDFEAIRQEEHVVLQV